MARIKLLPKEIYSKIAAGEVIDGPYSVVRELIDNSIDAKSTMIKIIINGGGKELIIVQDNGIGMSKEDVELAVKRHATSKISSIDDLEHIETMGFRGEALSAICSVSEFELTTKEQISDVGFKLACKYGKISNAEPVAFTQGTKVTVKNLYENVPARKKFMKSNRSESSRIKDVIVKKALCFNNISFVYESEDRMLFSFHDNQTRKERITSLFGREIDKHLIELSYNEKNFSIQGFISDKEFTLSNRNGQYIFINNRPIYNRSLHFIINEAVRGFVTLGRYVYAFIYLNVNPELIDVNVHPAKLEVKLKIEKEISSALYHTIQSVFQNKLSVIRNNIGYKDEVLGKDEILEKNNKYSYERLNSGSELSDKYIRVVRDAKLFESDKMDNSNTQYDIPFKIKEVKLNAEEVSTLDLDANEIGLNYIGSIFNGFLIFDTEESIILVDQHAAHERIMYEEYTKKYKDINPSKNLLIPINLTPPPGMYDEVMEYVEEFDKAGIKIEPFGDGSFNIVSIPAFLPENKESRIILEFFNEYFEKGNFPENGSKLKLKKLIIC